MLHKIQDQLGLFHQLGFFFWLNRPVIDPVMHIQFYVLFRIWSIWRPLKVTNVLPSTR